MRVRDRLTHTKATALTRGAVDLDLGTMGIADGFDYRQTKTGAALVT